MKDSNGQFTKGNNANPHGRGGFRDNPQNRNSGGRPTNQESITYWLRLFMNMTVKDFHLWKEQTPEDEVIVIADLAHTLISNARDSLKELKEVVDRTEGRASMAIDLTKQKQTIKPLIISYIEPRL